LGRLDDLERFQDLFYNPTTNRPQSLEMPPVAVLATEPEDQRPATSPVGLAGGGSRLATLVYQLGEDLYELRNEEHIPEDDDRLEGLNDQPSRGPVTSVVSPSLASALGETHPFLSTLSTQHRLDQPVASTRQKFPEDVESELSSLSDRIPEEDYDEITGSYYHPHGNTEAD
jgi:hypothetical protein